MAFTSHKDSSRTNWGVDPGPPSNDQIKLGCLQRIADACELMARQWDQIKREAEYQKKRAESNYRDVQKLQKQNAAYRGIIRRLKKERGL